MKKDHLLNSKTIISLALLVITLILFSRVRNHEFINYDDDVYVYNNQAVLAGISKEGAAWAFTATAGGNWHPVTWLSLMADAELSGKSPQVYHLTNLFLHAANGVLLFLLLSRITLSIYRSAFVAALFLFHPLHIESMAWIAERKDVLSTFFGIATLICYAAYAARPRVSMYALSLLLFALSLMSKPMAVTIPLLMLLLDWWPLRRTDGLHTRRLLLEKAPFLFLSLAAGVVTILAQQAEEAVVSGLDVPLALRVKNAAVSSVHYLVKTLWPADLAVLYPFPNDIPSWKVAGALAVLLGITFAACRSSLNLRRFSRACTFPGSRRTAST